MSLTEYARFRSRSTGWVSKQLQAGMPHSGGGRSGKSVCIDLAKAVAWEIDQARTEAQAPVQSERTRLQREQADRVALENAVRRGQLCEKADVESVVIGAVLAHKNERNGIAGRLANELVGLSAGEIRVRILDELRRVDEQFAQRVGAFAADEEKPA